MVRADAVNAEEVLCDVCARAGRGAVEGDGGGRARRKCQRSEGFPSILSSYVVGIHAPTSYDHRVTNLATLRDY